MRSLLTFWRLRRLRRELAKAEARDRADRSAPGDTREFYIELIEENAKLIRSLKWEISQLEETDGTR